MNDFRHNKIEFSEVVHLVQARYPNSLLVGCSYNGINSLYSWDNLASCIEGMLLWLPSMKVETYHSTFFMSLCHANSPYHM